jgi:hypothetical protein
MQEIKTRLVDDLDGKSTAAETVSFALDGQRYDIDLTAARARALRKVLAEYIQAGRKAAALETRARRPAAPSPGPEIREWAKARGIEVKERGRIPSGVVLQFRQSA